MVVVSFAAYETDGAGANDALYEKPTPRGDSRNNMLAVRDHRPGFCCSSVAPLVTVLLVVARKGPFSARKPSRAEQGGPPLNHSTSGALLAGTDSLSTSQ